MNQASRIAYWKPETVHKRLDAGRPIALPYVNGSKEGKIIAGLTIDLYPA